MLQYLPVRLGFVEVPFDGLRDIPRHLGALYDCGLEVFFEVKGVLGLL